MRDKFPERIGHDPAILVSADVVALSATLAEIQEIVDECVSWEKQNNFRWNPEKLQLLCLLRKQAEAQH